jgi:hypothetical protein
VSDHEWWIDPDSIRLRFPPGSVKGNRFERELTPEQFPVLTGAGALRHVEQPVPGSYLSSIGIPRPDWTRKEQVTQDTGVIRQFASGATRDTGTGKFDFEGFLSPLALERYGEFMHVHRAQSDGTLRAADNWQKGIPIPVYRSSLIRHVFTAWALWRGWRVKEEKFGGVLRQPTLQEALCGILFNTFGYLHELLQAEEKAA